MQVSCLYYTINDQRRQGLLEGNLYNRRNAGSRLALKGSSSLEKEVSLFMKFQGLGEFFQIETSMMDIIKTRRMYVDITGDLIAGILLSQILYWHSPNEDGSSKLRVKKEGSYWLAKTQKDWWEEIRISVDQYKRAVKILDEKNLIVKKVFKFDSAPTTHIRINGDVFIRYINTYLAHQEHNMPVDNFSDQPLEELEKKVIHRQEPYGAMEKGISHQSISGKSTNGKVEKPLNLNRDYKQRIQTKNTNNNRRWNEYSPESAYALNADQKTPVVVQPPTAKQPKPKQPEEPTLRNSEIDKILLDANITIPDQVIGPLVEKRGRDTVTLWIEFIRSNPGKIKNPGGFLRTALEKDWPLPLEVKRKRQREEKQEQKEKLQKEAQKSNADRLNAWLGTQDMAKLCRDADQYAENLPRVNGSMEAMRMFYVWDTFTRRCDHVADGVAMEAVLGRYAVIGRKMIESFIKNSLS